MWRPDRAVRRWMRLGRPERFVVAEAVITLAAASVAAALVAPSRLASWRPAPRADRRCALPAARIAALTAATAARLPYGRGCLPQSLALARMLARRGQPVDLVLGVGKPGGAFAAHAWVELDGAVLVSPETAGLYAPIWRRPS